MFLMQEELSDKVPDWANMSGDIVRYIADKTWSVRDRVCMSTVCQSWQASAVDQKLNFPVCLLLAEKEGSDQRCLYNVSEEIFVELDLPEIRGRRCWGSPFGWLVTCGLDLEFRLFNPLSRASLPLPSLRTLFDYEDEQCSHIGPEFWCTFYLRKVILSSSPEESGSDCIVLAIYSCRYIAFAKPGDKAWTRIDNINGADDAIYFKGNVFFCKWSGEIFRCQDLYGARPKAMKFAPPPTVNANTAKYLFDLGGNLCLACRRAPPVFKDEDEDGDRDEDEEENEDEDQNEDEDEDEDDWGNFSYVTAGFNIFKLDMHTRCWEKMFTLGDNSLFLGHCCAFLITAVDYHGCRPNCIYFTDDNIEHYSDTGSRDRGIYNCENLKLDLDEVDASVLDGIVEYFPKSKDVQHLLLSYFSPPLWLIPYSR